MANEGTEIFDFILLFTNSINKKEMTIRGFFDFD